MNEGAMRKLRIDPEEQGSSSGIAIQDSRAYGEALLRNQILWFVRLRFGVVLGLLLGWCAKLAGVLDVFHFTITGHWLLWTAMLLLGANVCFQTHGSGMREPAGLRLNLWCQILLDLVVLSWTVHELGSLFTPAPFLYLLHIVLACMFLDRRHSLLVFVLAVLLYSGCISLERASGCYHWPFWRPPVETELGHGVSFVAWTVSIWAAAWYLSTTLAQAIQDRDRALAESHSITQQSYEDNRRHMQQTAHQLKSPVVGIQTYLNLYRFNHTDLPDDVAELFEGINARCETLSALVGDILELASLRAGQHSLEKAEPVNIAELLQECILQLKPNCESREVIIVDELESFLFSGRKSCLKRMLENLVSNAINYSHQAGRVHVRCRNSHDGAIVEVEDQGIGIREEEISRVFDEYYRASKAKQHYPLSTGVGLAIVREIAALHGITIELESRFRKGTKFRLLFPHAAPLVKG